MTVKVWSFIKPPPKKLYAVVMWDMKAKVSMHQYVSFCVFYMKECL